MLTVVGTGIQPGVQTTLEARALFERADEAFYLAADPVGERWLAELNPHARSLQRHYVPGRHRAETYRAMTDEILDAVRRGGRVCAAFYGHPGVFVAPSHDAVRRARDEGFEARMLPAVSAEDCLFADLGVDPATSGCQSYEATDFLVHRRRVDPSAALVLWQMTVLGELAHAPLPPARRLDVLVDYLRAWYPAGHEVVVYAASPFPIVDASVQRLPLAELPGAEPPPLATLFVPPAEERRADAEMLRRLGLDAD